MPHAGARTCAAVAHGRPMRAGINAPTPPTSSSRHVENVIFSQPRGRASGWPMGTSSAPGVEVRGSNSRNFLKLELLGATAHPPRRHARVQWVRRHCALVDHSWSLAVSIQYSVLWSRVVLLLACSARFIMQMGINAQKKNAMGALSGWIKTRPRRATSERAPSRARSREKTALRADSRLRSRIYTII
jgi:hypothetical protein